MRPAKCSAQLIKNSRKRSSLATKNGLIVCLQASKMATYLKKDVETLVGDPSPVAPGWWCRVRRPLGKLERVRSLPQDVVGRQLLTLFTVYPELKSRFRSSGESLNDFSKCLQAMADNTKDHLLSRVERYLDVPRSEDEFVD